MSAGTPAAAEMIAKSGKSLYLTADAMGSQKTMWAGFGYATPQSRLPRSRACFVGSHGVADFLKEARTTARAQQPRLRTSWSPAVRRPITSWTGSRIEPAKPGVPASSVSKHPTSPSNALRVMLFSQLGGVIGRPDCPSLRPVSKPFSPFPLPQSLPMKPPLSLAPSQRLERGASRIEFGEGVRCGRGMSG